MIKRIVENTKIQVTIVILSIVFIPFQIWMLTQGISTIWGILTLFLMVFNLFAYGLPLYKKIRENRDR